MQRLRFLLMMILVLLAGNTAGQIFGGTSPGIRWKQINIPQARVIYPMGMDSVAKKIAANITLISTEAQKTIGGRMKKVPVVLRNAGLVSNGYVSLVPFRSEFYLAAPQNPFELGSLPWPDMLSVHEYRHVEQYSNFDVGLSHVVKSIFGQSGQALANAAAVPDWFFEGDAVYQETNFTKQGRGALPYFYNGYRSLWRDGKKYSWMKLRNGSYLDFVPDKYTLGFILTAYGRERSGIGIWEKVTHDAASFKSLLYPFQSAFRKHSGMRFSVFRDSAFQFFRRQFRDSVPFLPEPGYYLNEEFPHYTENGELVYLQSSVKSAPAFYLRKDGRDNRIRTADYMVENYFSYRNGKIVYASRRPDIRWGYKAFNEVQVLDIKTGKQQRVTKGSRYFSPDIDATGNRIVAVDLPVSGSASLHILDAQTGKVVKKLKKEGLINYAYPKFYGDTVVSCVTDTLGRMSLVIFNTRNDSSEMLLPFAYNVIGFPLLRHDTLYFSMSYRTNDELFALDLKEKNLLLVGNSQGAIGKYHAAIGEGLISWSTFTSRGQRIQQSPFADLTFTRISERNYLLVTSSFGLFSINNVNSNLIYRSADTGFTSEKYPPLSHPFHFHSIIPDANDPVYTVSLFGENLLSTIQSEISLSYDRSDHSKTSGVSITYARCFPVLTGGLNYEIDNRFLNRDTLVYYNSVKPFIGFYIPLNLSKGRNFTSAIFGSNFVYNSTAFRKPFQKRFNNYSYSYLSSYISFVNQSQKAAAQVLPRFGQSLYFNYKFPLSTVSGFQWLSTAGLFFPGIGRTHSFNVTLSYSQKDTLREINFSNSFPFARGYEAVNLWKMTALQLNYQLPLFYPEWGFGDLVYFLRVRGNLFFDQAFTKTVQHIGGTFRSAGSEIYFDTKWWNQVPVSFGVRYARLLDKDLYGSAGRNRWELILPVNVFGR